MRRPHMANAGPRRARGDRGAAAVEFALVLTLLVPLLFGIIDYGIWFADTLGVRHGVHEAARLGVVKNPTCTTGTTDAAKYVCTAKQQVGALGGPAYAYVKAPQGWARTKPLVVCVMVKENGVTGVTPLPAGRIIRAKAEMAIEYDTAASNPTISGSWTTGAGDTAPSGTDWSWCS